MEKKKSASIESRVQIAMQVANSRFVGMESIATTLANAVAAGLNVIMYGPGGYGKSELAMVVGKAIYGENDVIVKACSTNTSVYDLFGPPDIKKLTKEGKMVFNTDDSILTQGKMVVLEEAFDAPSDVLAALKDSMTSGYIRNGKQLVKTDYPAIVICTNKSPDEFADGDPSISALMERFPVQILVRPELGALGDQLLIAQANVHASGGRLHPTAISAIYALHKASMASNAKKTLNPRKVAIIAKAFSLTHMKSAPKSLIISMLQSMVDLSAGDMHAIMTILMNIDENSVAKKTIEDVGKMIEEAHMLMSRDDLVSIADGQEKKANAIEKLTSI